MNEPFEEHELFHGDMPMSDEREILSASDIHRILTEISTNILQAHENIKNLVFVGIHTRGVYLAKRLQAAIANRKHIEVPTGTIDITLYRDDWTRIDFNPVVQDTSFDFSVDGKEVILIDDVLFTGRTIRAAMDALMDYGRPDRIELAVLVDRGYRELPIQADYTGMSVTTHYTETVNVMMKEHDGEDKVLIMKGKI